MELEGKLISFPLSDGSSVNLDLSEIFEGERRQEEIACVTPLKAQELMRAFSAAWRAAHKKMLFVNEKLVQVTKEVGNRRSTVLVDVVPGLLKEKELASSAEIRKALVDLDPEVQRLQDILDETATILEFMKGKLRTFERDHSAVKAIVKDGTYRGAIDYGPNPNLSGGASSSRAPERERPASVPASAGRQQPVRAGFGRAAVG